MKKPNRQEIVAALVATINDEATPQQRDLLQQWVERDSLNRDIYNAACNVDVRNNAVSQMASYDVQRAWQNVLRQVVTRRRRKMTRVAASVAAAAVVVVAVITAVQTSFRQPEYAHGELIQPGSPKAIVTFADGRSVMLDTVTVADMGSAVIKDSREMTFREPETVVEPVEQVSARFNTIDIPMGGEYKIVLADGSTVYLNSGSTLKFNENFNKDSIRELFLSGEGYFVVASNKEKPFVVNCGEIKVMALGTSFNVSNYSNDAYNTATVVSGEVCVEACGQSRDLSKNQQIKVHNGQVEYDVVVAENYISWINANIMFDQMTIDQILNKLERWYDVEFVYENDSSRKASFSGCLPRYKNISEVLKLIELAARIEFSVDGRVITVKQSKNI